MCYRMVGTLATGFCLILFAGCASIINGPSQKIIIESNPPGAKCSMDLLNFVTPETMQLSRDNNYLIKCGFPGEPEQSFIVAGRVSGWTLLDAIIPPLLFFDFNEDGAAFKLYPEYILVKSINSTQIEKKLLGGIK